jgi:hypothetical protein
MGQLLGFVGNCRLAAILALAWHARGQKFKSPILHRREAAIEQESGESSTESKTTVASSTAVSFLLTTFNPVALDEGSPKRAGVRREL